MSDEQNDEYASGTLGKKTADISELVNDFNESVDKITCRLSSSDMHHADGLSFLELKNRTMVSYLVNLCRLVNQQLKGKPADFSSPDSEAHAIGLAEFHKVFEAIEPIEKKLRYEIDRLLKLDDQSHSTHNDETKPSSSTLRANPDRLQPVDEQSLSSSGGESDENATDDEDESGLPHHDDSRKKRIYRPPRISAMSYDRQDKTGNSAEVAKTRLSTGVLEELRAQYDDRPTEIREEVDKERLQMAEQKSAIQRYEEEHFVRLTMSKQQKKGLKTQRRSTSSALDILSNLADSERSSEPASKAAKLSNRKSIRKTFKKSKSSFRRRRKANF